MVSDVAVSMYSICRLFNRITEGNFSYFYALEINLNKSMDSLKIRWKYAITLKYSRPLRIIAERSQSCQLEMYRIVGKKQQQSLVLIVDRQTSNLWPKSCSTGKSLEVREATVYFLHPIKVKDCYR